MIPTIQSLAELYVLGCSNTPIYLFDTGRLDPQLLQSWTAFTKQNKSSRYHHLIASLVEAANRHGQTITQEERPLFASYGMGQAFDQWWRVQTMRH